MKWCGYEWITQERWGNIHPEKTLNWYDPSAVEVRGDYLILKTHKNPKYFDKLELTSPIGTGLVSCTEKFSYGWFSLEAMLPKGPNLWPAFWMWAWESWPPEIDIFEGYSNKRGSYFNWSHDMLLGKFWRMKSNIHLKHATDETNEGGIDRHQLGDQAHYYTWENPTKYLMDYGLLWLPDKLEFYYNDRMVREVNDPAVMKQLQDVKMNVIINNHVTAEIDLDKFKPSEFVVSNFRYVPMEDLVFINK